MPAKNLLAKYEKIVVPILLVICVILFTALAFIWWQVLNAKPLSQPGDFLKVDSNITATPLPTK